MDQGNSSTAPDEGRRARMAAGVLGFALGGFFDGILLHQILQWHHLLSAVEAANRDLRVLVLADGLFHALMYLLATVGLWLLWRARRSLGAPGMGGRVFAFAAIGFGLWHVVDAILSHWLLGIHRIRTDAGNPLFWDLLWLAAFGIVPLALGLMWRRGGSSARLASSPLALALAVLAAAPIAAVPPPASNGALVLFRSGVSPAQAHAAMRAAGGSLLWTDQSGLLWALELPPGADSAALYAGGALVVSTSLLPAGCLGWSAPAGS